MSESSDSPALDLVRSQPGSTYMMHNLKLDHSDSHKARVLDQFFDFKW